MDAREFAPGRMTGIRRHLEGLVTGLIEARPDWRILLLVNPGSDTPRFGGQVTYLRESGFFTLLFDQATTHRVLRQFRADLYYSPYFKVPVFTRVPVLSTVHDIMDVALPSCRAERGELRSGILSLLLRKYLKASRFVTCDSAFTRSEILRLYPDLESVEDRFRVLPLDFRPPEVPPAPFPALAKKLNLHSPYLLYAGNFKPHKRVPLLIRAWKALRDAGGCLHDLVLAGGGGADEAEVLASARAAGPGVHVLKGIPEAELHSLYAHATLLVHPSVYEGFGYPVVEAFHHGLPVALCRASSLPEVGGEAAAYFEPDNAESLKQCIGRLLGSPVELSERGKKGRERLARFTAGRFREGFISLAESAVIGPV